MPKILVIEDDRVGRELAGLLLTRLGYSVALADCGRAGLAAARSRGFDLLLADLNLGDLTALDVMRALRQEGIRVPTVVLTGFGTIDTAVEAMKLGAVDYLEKPIDDEALEHLVRSTLQMSGAMPLLESEHYASTMWADAVAALSRHTSDVKNFAEWGRALGMSTSTIRRLCRAAKISPRASLVLGRLLRAVVKSAHQPWIPAERLRVSDPRTLARMLRAGGLPADAPAVSVDELLQRQTLVTNTTALVILRERVERMCDGGTVR